MLRLIYPYQLFAKRITRLILLQSSWLGLPTKLTPPAGGFPPRKISQMTRAKSRDKNKDQSARDEKGMKRALVLDTFLFISFRCVVAAAVISFSTTTFFFINFLILCLLLFVLSLSISSPENTQHV